MYFTCEAQIRAVSDEGEEVILNSNGSWSYLNPKENLKVTTSKIKFYKSDDCNDSIKSNRNKVAIHFNSNKWNFKKSKNKSAEIDFSLRKFKKIQAILLTEKTRVNVDTLAKFSIMNAKINSQNPVIIKEREYRIVNDNVVLYVKYFTKIKDIAFNYWAYYHSGEDGSTQFLVASPEPISLEDEKSIKELLNGFILLEN